MGLHGRPPEHTARPAAKIAQNEAEFTIVSKAFDPQQLIGAERMGQYHSPGENRRYGWLINHQEP
jgi:hypothetical protein